MTLLQFDMMDEMEQIKAIAHHGEEVAEREDESFFYRLHRIDSFFIEEKIQKAPDTFYSKSQFIARPDMNPYMKKIDVSVK